MQWEFLGSQELVESPDGKKGYIYKISLWRTPVPGGWLLMTVNARSNDPQPTVSFYPDGDHEWNGQQDAQAQYLLRAAGPTPAIAGADSLVRPTAQT